LELISKNRRLGKRRSCTEGGELEVLEAVKKDRRVMGPTSQGRKYGVKPYWDATNS